MKFWGKLAVAASVAWISSTAFALTDPTTRQGESLSALEKIEASDDARYVEHWIHEKGDDHGRPFVIVDKKDGSLKIDPWVLGSLIASGNGPRTQEPQHDDEHHEHRDAADVDHDLRREQEVGAEAGEQAGDAREREAQEQRRVHRVLVQDDGQGREQHQGRQRVEDDLFDHDQFRLGWTSWMLTCPSGSRKSLAARSKYLPMNGNLSFQQRTISSRFVKMTS